MKVEVKGVIFMQPNIELRQCKYYLLNLYKVLLDFSIKA